MENSNEMNTGRTAEEGRKLFANIDGDKQFSFLSAAGGEFTQLLNSNLHRFSNPWVQEGKVVFRSVKEGASDFNPATWVEDKNRIMVLVGDYSCAEKIFEQKLVCQRAALVAADGCSGNDFVDRHRKNTTLRYIATQQHLLGNELFDWIESQSQILPLGTLRSGFHELEPEMRETEGCIFNFSAMRKSDAPAKSGFGVSGLSSEEACRLVRYFGIGDHSRILWIKGFDVNGDFSERTADLVAQLVWYFLNGAVHRPGDYPLSRENLIEYTVSGREGVPDIKFYKSRFSGRWWFSTGSDFNLLNVHPCSYEDYLLMCEGEISDRIILASEG